MKGPWFVHKHTAVPVELLIAAWGHLPSSTPNRLSHGDREKLSWVKTAAFLSFLVWILTWSFLRWKGVERQSVSWFWPLGLLLGLIDSSLISTHGCRGQTVDTHASPVAYMLVMTNGKGHTLALCPPHTASHPVMDSPPHHHHLLLGPRQNQ